MNWLYVLPILPEVLADGMIVAGFVGIIYYSVGYFRSRQRYRQLAKRANPGATHLKGDIERFLAALGNLPPESSIKAMKRTVTQCKRRAGNPSCGDDTDRQS